MSDKRITVALGGNAILRSKALDSYEEQFQNIRRTCRQIVELIAEGYQPIVVHGNGPQVGNLLIQNEAAAHLVPAVPLDVCGAETQGQIGYMILLVREPFSAGSMGPKVRAAYRFVRDSGGQATICSLEEALAGLRGEAGTVVGPDDQRQLTLTA